MSYFNFGSVLEQTNHLDFECFVKYYFEPYFVIVIGFLVVDRVVV